MFALVYPKFRAFTPITNLPLVGGKLFSYEVDTTVPKTLYADPELTEPLTNPVILDSNGEATIYGEGSYDLELKTALDVVLWTAESISFDDDGGGGVINTSLEWIEEQAVVTFLDVDSFSVPGDQLDLFHVNRRVKVDLSASSLYGTVTSATFAAGETTVVLDMDSGSIVDDIVAVSIGILDSLNDSIPRIVGFLALTNVWTSPNTFEDAVVIDSTLNVTGAVDFDSNLNVDGSAVIDLTLSVGTDLTVGDDLIVTDDTTIGGDLVVGLTLDAGSTTVDALGVDIVAPATGGIATSGDIEAGGLVFATDGFKMPGTGGETLKITRGVVDSAGAVTEGSGFTAVRNSTGDFTITFSTAFSDVPSFQATPVGTNRSITIVAASTTQVNYQIRANNDNALANNDHHILAVGPK